MFSENIYMPYFYIIRHIETNKQYAGSRWAKGCHPDEFMKEDGYITSSPIIHDIIKTEGLDKFEIVDIITLDEMNIPFGTNSVYAYESWFLSTNNCATSDCWYNAHNNLGMAFGTESFYIKSKQTFLELYGVDNPFKSEEIQEKIKESHNKNLGVDYPMQSEIIKQKSIETCLIKYGYEFTSQVPSIREKQTQTRFDKNDGKYYSKESIDKRIDTCLEKYGVESPMQLNQTIIKSRLTKIEKYNDENYNNVKQNKQTKLERYGNENYNNYEKNRQTCLEKYGVDNASKSEIVKQNTILTNQMKYGVNCISEIILTCPHCGKSGSKPPMTRWHFDNCKLKE